MLSRNTAYDKCNARYEPNKHGTSLRIRNAYSSIHRNPWSLQVPPNFQSDRFEILSAANVQRNVHLADLESFPQTAAQHTTLPHVDRTSRRGWPSMGAVDAVRLCVSDVAQCGISLAEVRFAQALRAAASWRTCTRHDRVRTGADLHDERARVDPPVSLQLHKTTGRRDVQGIALLLLFLRSRPLVSTVITGVEGLHLDGCVSKQV